MEVRPIFCMICFENRPTTESVAPETDGCVGLLSSRKKNTPWTENITFWGLSFLLCPQILMMNKDINRAELDFLLRYPVQPDATAPVDFGSNLSWWGIQVDCILVTAYILRQQKGADSSCQESCSHDFRYAYIAFITLQNRSLHNSFNIVTFLDSLDSYFLCMLSWQIGIQPIIEACDVLCNLIPT